MNQDLSILQLVLGASIVVQLVMLLLLVVSITSWAAIFRKLFALRRVKSLNDDFEREFWSGTSLNDLFSSAAQNAKLSGPMERIFASGMREYQKLRERRITDAGTLLDGARRAMRASYQRELDAVETTCPSWPRSARCRPTWACSARCGASCTPSPAWARCSR
jgi:biopolymer transport protein TolQ